ncbi:MAG: iron donor protein CyaY [Planctomycetes bacterium]|nr:iron donor protein CyaY [Planctomycetota bacterium]
MLDEKTYYQITRDVMKDICRRVDELARDDVQADITAGGLIIDFADRRKLVLSQQTPARQLWLAAPSGGFHFDYDAATGTWKDTRDGGELYARIGALIRERVGGSLRW